MGVEQVRCVSRNKTVAKIQLRFQLIFLISFKLTSLPETTGLRLPELVGVCAKFFITLDVEPGLEPPCCERGICFGLVPECDVGKGT